MNFNDIGLRVPTVMLPASHVDLSKWAVIACDQYTSQPEYWRQVHRIVGENPSTLHLILPEAFLDEGGREHAIERIAATMHEYLDTGIIAPLSPGFIVVERHTARGRARHGLIAALDLETYDFRPGATSLIRASEGTVVERLPPRAHIRERAFIEIPHVMVLIDDPEMTVIEPLLAERLPSVYDFELMLGGGRIVGRHVGELRLQQQVATALSRLASPRLFSDRYGIGDRPALLYALGDGNHSFAAAKLVWERVKAGAADPRLLESHPARYALVELVNIHDPGLTFEPIHRLVRGVRLEDLFRDMRTYYREQGSTCSYRLFGSYDAMAREPGTTASRAGHRICFVAGDMHGIVAIDTPRSALPTGSLQAYFDRREQVGRPVDIDYIHGDDALRELASRPGCTGIFLPPLSKHELFRTIVLDGALPRKTFSLGDADDKRFYLECRRIAPQE